MVAVQKIDANVTGLRYQEETSIGVANTSNSWLVLEPNSYERIGYAESKNGIDWERLDDEAGIDISASGWDSEMIEYSFVFSHKETVYMLYNGNDHGKSGFGYAVLE